MSYYVVLFGEDGDVRLAKFTKEELEAKLNADWWGSNPTFLNEESDLQNQGCVSGLFIIKGERIQPNPAQVVKQWQV